MADHQNERAFQKQTGVFLNKKVIGDVKKAKKVRRINDVGLGFKTPKDVSPCHLISSFLFSHIRLSQFDRQAIEGTYIDKKCPFTGDVHIRGRILKGIVQKMKMQRTIVIRRDYLHYVRKYKRFEKRHKNMSVHLSPAFRSVTLPCSVTLKRGVV